MGKGEYRSNKEQKKPKQPKQPKTGTPVSPFSATQTKSGGTGKKR